MTKPTTSVRACSQLLILCDQPHGANTACCTAATDCTLLAAPPPLTALPIVKCQVLLCFTGWRTCWSLVACYAAGRCTARSIGPYATCSVLKKGLVLSKAHLLQLLSQLDQYFLLHRKQWCNWLGRWCALYKTKFS